MPFAIPPPPPPEGWNPRSTGDLQRLPSGDVGTVLRVVDGGLKWVDPAEEAAKREVEEFLGPLPI
jgi:hypothetical protein